MKFERTSQMFKTHLDWFAKQAEKHQAKLITLEEAQSTISRRILDDRSTKTNNDSESVTGKLVTVAQIVEL